MPPTNEHQPAGGAERQAAPPIAPEDLQDGDAVTVKAIYKQRSFDFVDVILAGSIHPFRVPFDGIATHTPKPRPLAPGDRVRFSNSAPSVTGPILALHGNTAWVAWEDDSNPSTEYLSKLERVPGAIQSAHLASGQGLDAVADVFGVPARFLNEPDSQFRRRILARHPR